MSKDLKSKAIKIKGKNYVLVSDRVNFFNESYPNGFISTELVSNVESDRVVVKATVTPDAELPARTFTGYSQAVIGDGMVNKTAALENAETSAVGRALGFMGIGVLESIASADEMHKATSNTGSRLASEKQIQWMRDTVRKYTEQDVETNEKVDSLIQEILTLKPQQVPLFKVKDAVDHITNHFKPMQRVEVTMADGQKFDLEDLPY